MTNDPRRQVVRGKAVNVARHAAVETSRRCAQPDEQRGKQVRTEFGTITRRTRRKADPGTLRSVLEQGSDGKFRDRLFLVEPRQCFREKPEPRSAAGRQTLVTDEPAPETAGPDMKSPIEMTDHARRFEVLVTEEEPDGAYRLRCDATFVPRCGRTDGGVDPDRRDTVQHSD